MNILWSEAMNPSALGALLLVFLIVYVFLRRPKKNKGIAPLPPGTIGLPFLGYLPFLGNNLHHTFMKLSSIYRPIFKVMIGYKRCVVVSSAALVKEVLREQDVIFTNRYPTIAASIFSYGSHDIAFNSYGPEWRKLRKLFVNGMMSKASLDAYSHMREQQVKEMVGKLYDRRNMLVDIGEMGRITLLNMTMTMVWGHTVTGVKRRDIEAKSREVVAELMICLGMPNISDSFPMLARFDIQGVEKRMRKISAWCESIFDSVIDEYHKIRHDTVDALDGRGREKRTDFMHLVMNKLEDQEDHANSLSPAEVKGLLQDIVIAGTDTTATTIEWAMTELLLHPEIMKKAQEELRDVVGLDNLVQEFHLSKLKYLATIIKETFRLHPSLVFLIPHCPNKSTIVGGYSIPKGIQVFINTYFIHRDPQLWEDPLKFRPQRFQDMNRSLDYMGKDLEFIPFGSGRRMCPSIPLVEKTAMLVLGSILHAFDWKLPNGVELDLEERYGIILKKLKPLVAIPIPRLSNLDIYECNSTPN